MNGTRGLKFPFCPEPPDWRLDWHAIVTEFPEVRALQGCPQDPDYHAEGDVLTHTQMVCETLCALGSWRSLSPADRVEVFAATLLHDVAKPLCTREERGRVTSRRHSLKGAQIARQLIWRLNPDVSSREFLRKREAIVGLVSHHSLPLHFLSHDDPRYALIRAAATTRLDWLSILTEADVRGRSCHGQGELLDRVAMFRDFAEELRCLHGPYDFAGANTRFLYFQKPGIAPDVEYYDDSRCTVTLMCGLPASGKDTWIKSHLQQVPLISLDSLRGELLVSPDDNQGRVGTEARNRAKAFLREGQSFAWNATNTTRRVRRALVDLFTAYRAKVHMVYVETSINEQYRRNERRPKVVPPSIIERLRQRLDVPDATEATHVEWVPT